MPRAKTRALRLCTNTIVIVVLLITCAVSSHAQTKSVVQLVKKTKVGAVLITVKDAFGIERGQGSGFFISPNRIVTNHHVVKGAAIISVMMHDSTVLKCNRVVAVDSVDDLALIQIETTKNVAVQALQVDTMLPDVGERVIVISNPLGLDQSVSDGIVASIRKMDESSRSIQFTAPISSGSSGSPLLNEEGKVIGVVKSTMVAGQNLNFAAPIGQLFKLDTTSEFEFTKSTKVYLGKEVALTDAIYVVESKIMRPPPGLTVREYNLWLFKQYAAKSGWDSTTISTQGPRLERLTRRFAEKELDEDKLDGEDVQRIIDEAFGAKTQAKIVTEETYEKEQMLKYGMMYASRYVDLSGKASTVKNVVQVISDRYQEIVELREGVNYVIVTVSDDCIRDLDAVLFKETDKGWIPVASDTDPDARPMLWYTPEESGRYAIVWQLARKWKTCKETVFGSVIVASQE